MTHDSEPKPELAPRQAAKIARLARLALSEEETAALSADLERILAHVAKLDEVDVTGIAPLAQPVPLELPQRDDEPRATITRDEVLRGAEEVKRGQFRVPRVVDG